MHYAFIFDFDSTIITVESLDEVLLLSVDGSKKEQLKKELEAITDLGMNGDIDLKSSIERRINLISLKESDIKNFQSIVVNLITPGITDTIKLLKKYNCDIYFISGGLLECILPVAKELEIPEQNCFANTYNIKDNKIILDDNNSLMHSDGKSKIIKSIKKLYPEKKLVIIGDGISDLIPYETGIADIFIGFGVNKIRQKVQEKAPQYFINMDEFIKHIRLLLKK